MTRKLYILISKARIQQILTCGMNCKLIKLINQYTVVKRVE